MSYNAYTILKTFSLILRIDFNVCFFLATSQLKRIFWGMVTILRKRIISTACNERMQSLLRSLLVTKGT